MALTERQKQEAQELFSKGYTTSQVFRHFGAQSIGKESEIDTEQSAIQSMNEKPALKPLANKITDFLGLGGATEVFGRKFARTPMGAEMTTSPETKATNEMLGVSNLESNRAGIAEPTGKELAGAGLQTLATAAAPAFAPIGLGAQVAVGAGLGYMYDVGGDLVDGASTAETLTPGAGTVIGVAAPPVLRGFGRFLKGPATNVASQTLPPSTANVMPDKIPTQIVPTSPVQSAIPDQVSNGGSAIKQTITDLGESAKRVGTRLSEKTQEQALKAERIASASNPAVKQAIQVNLDEPMVDFATNADKATREAARKMVQIAESPKKIGTNARPTQVAEEKALEQYDLVVKNKKAIGQQIGEISEQFPTLKNIDVTPTQNNLMEVMKNNGLSLNMDGQIIASDNLKISDEQLTVINKLFDKVTKQNTVSAKNLHELDQWFSGTQRKSRMVDKIDDVYVTVPTPDGKTKEVNIFKVFRDAFGQRLDEVAPDNLRTLNKQYRQYSNFLEDVEGKLISNPEFSDLVASTADTDKFAEAGLRRIFGEGKGAADREAIYNALDNVSRELGYQGPRADDLYAFGEELKKLYPETIQKTSFRGQIGASIMDKLSTVMDVGKVSPKDQQDALKALLEMSTE